MNGVNDIIASIIIVVVLLMELVYIKGLETCQDSQDEFLQSLLNTLKKLQKDIGKDNHEQGDVE